MQLANVKTKSEAVDTALRRFVHSGKQERLLDLHGTGGVRKVTITSRHDWRRPGA